MKGESGIRFGNLQGLQLPVLRDAGDGGCGTDCSLRCICAVTDSGQHFRSCEQKRLQAFKQLTDRRLFRECAYAEGVRDSVCIGCDPVLFKNEADARQIGRLFGV